MITRNFPYFKTETHADGRPAPEPLSHSVERTVRFEEVDSINMMWHGRYPSFFEDGRVAFGALYGIGYSDLYAAGLMVPIKQLSIDYIAPLRFGDTCRITTTLHWTAASKLNFSYCITGASGDILTTGYTVQLFLTATGQLCMVKPNFFLDFCSRWESGAFACSA